jgi:hypothetical protein
MSTTEYGFKADMKMSMLRTGSLVNVGCLLWLFTLDPAAWPLSFQVVSLGRICAMVKVHLRRGVIRCAIL